MDWPSTLLGTSFGTALGGGASWLITHVYYARALRDETKQHADDMERAEERHREQLANTANQVGRIAPAVEALLHAVEKIPGVKIARDSAGKPTGGLEYNGTVLAISGLKGTLPTFKIASLVPPQERELVIQTTRDE